MPAHQRQDNESTSSIQENINDHTILVKNRNSSKLLYDRAYAKKKHYITAIQIEACLVAYMIEICMVLIRKVQLGSRVLRHNLPLQLTGRLPLI